MIKTFDKDGRFFILRDVFTGSEMSSFFDRNFFTKPIVDAQTLSVLAHISAHLNGVSTSDHNSSIMTPPMALRYELVRVGHQKLVGEIIKLEGDTASIQVGTLCRHSCPKPCDRAIPVASPTHVYRPTACLAHGSMLLSSRMLSASM